MNLTSISERILYYPHQPETDRPLLAYVNGNAVALAIDAGNSAAHVDEFYEALRSAGLSKPDITVITHWHWDHTFGMHRVSGLTIAHSKTNEYLGIEKDRLHDDRYADALKKDDACLEREYEGDKDIVVTVSDIAFEEELVLNLGGVTARVFHAESPHSEDSVFVYIPEEKVLFLGDATSEDFFNDGFMDKEKLRALMRMIEEIDCELCIVGHAEPLTKQTLLDYLESLDLSVGLRSR